MARRNYNETDNTQMRIDYLRNPCIKTVERLSVEMRRPKMSIVAKLTHMGVYKKSIYLCKDGSLPRSKDEILENLQNMLLVESLEGLRLAGKGSLKDTENSIMSLVSDYEENLTRKDDLIDTLYNRIDLMKEVIKNYSYSSS